MSDSDNYDYEDDIDDSKHEKIVEDVLNLNKIQNLKKPSRTEPTLKISEFDLVKSVTGNKGAVHINELTKVLKNRKLAEIGKNVTRTSKKATTLPKPLEKPQADKIRRTVAYEKNRLEFDRWEAFITSNRAASHISFPLAETDSLTIENSAAIPSNWRVKSDLQKKLEQIEKVEVYNVEPTSESFPLSMEELVEKRKESAKLRAHQRYKEAKARRQNKIKSKKYHRIQRREKIKQQLKEFELLQKTNPEEALKKLEDIERARAEERFSLRHKGTGQWARNKQIRAKYDKESRQALAQQLTVSRDLTQKLKKTGDDSSEDEGIESGESLPATTGSDNPWVNGMKPEAEVVNFVSGYRKYWDQRNKKLEEENGDADDEKFEEDTDEMIKEFKKVMEKSKVNKKKKSKKLEQKIESVDDDENTMKNPVNKKKKSQKTDVNKSLNNSTSTSEWEVSLIEKDDNNEDTETIEDIFYKLEDKMTCKMQNKLKKLQKNKREKKSTTKIVEKKKIDLTMKSKSKKHIIDEPLNENSNREENSTSEIKELKAILDSVNTKESKNIDPDKFIHAKTTNLDTAIPNLLTNEDEENTINQRDIIMEAFEDDDIVEDFNKEKIEEIEKDKPKDVDLSLPGWGNWGGTGIVPSKRKKKRFIIKAPAKMPRRDDNKGSLIINENTNTKVKEHLVADVPFPFSTVKDFEASIRAPISNSFVPETAFKRYIEPAVKTKMGTIIEPVTKTLLMGVPKRKF
ncbi:unnamed protein product [Brassicogethes aeneus]|uniref:U3 small nucleolar RNA-associated protein 14 homolog A n=1 Tax=Brassicogethes aeneus TaxID=1431903 RepID=A0A9P0FS99_BRAAE|nr:unnamed protein product [Brassicogethes aeneus]